MLLLSLLTLITSTSLTMLFIPSPVLLGTLVLLLALQMSLTLSMMASSWFAFLLFLIYIGGLLVMFSYFAALSPNHPTNINRPTLIFSTTLLALTIIFQLISPTLNFTTVMPTTTASLLSLFTTKNLPLLFFMALILFFALILVVKISSRTLGPLRPFIFPSNHMNQ